MDNHTQVITADEVVAYLQDHPQFFIDRPDALDSLEIVPSPDGTISLARHQVTQLQHKNTKLQQQLASFIESAQQNSALQTQVHQLCLRLIDTQNFEDLLLQLVSELKQEFYADDVALRLFCVPENSLPSLPARENIALLNADSDDMLVFDGILTQQPVCGRPSHDQRLALFNEQADKIQSFVCLPIGRDPCAGIIAIASFDDNRFHANMATDYLCFLGEIVMRLLKRYRADGG